MQPVHIDEINYLDKKSKLPPGAGEYELPPTFGRHGSMRSFSSKHTYDQVLREKVRDYPGPTSYDLPSTFRGGPNSLTPNPISQKFSQA